MELTKISTENALLNMALEEPVKSGIRREMLKYMDSDILGR